MFICTICSFPAVSVSPAAKELIYSLRFEIDHASIESGTYVYGPKNTTARRLGSSEIGLSSFYPLRMRIKLRDDSYKSVVVDLDSAMQTLRANHDLSKSPVSGEQSGSAVVVKVCAQSVSIDYHVYRDFKGPENQFYFKTTVFPMAKVPLQ